MIKKLGILLFVLGILSASTIGVYAVDGTTPSGGSGTSIDLGELNPLGATCKDAQCILYNLLDIASTIMLIIMPFIILWGAYQIMTAGGDPKKFQTGGKTILYAVIGFIIALMAKNIVSILVDALNQATSAK
jgi:hypothetical protein